MPGGAVDEIRRNRNCRAPDLCLQPEPLPIRESHGQSVNLDNQRVGLLKRPQPSVIPNHTRGHCNLQAASKRRSTSVVVRSACRFCVPIAPEAALFARASEPRAFKPQASKPPSPEPYFALATTHSPTSVNTSGAIVSSICAYSASCPVFAVWRR